MKIEKDPYGVDTPLLKGKPQPKLN